MCIEDVGIATVVVDGNIISIVLEDVACVCCIAAAYKFSNMATLEAFNSCTPLFVVPGCTVLQEDIDCTVELFIAAICGIAFILEAIIGNTGPYGVCGCQAQVYFSVKLRLISIHCTGRCTYITLQYQLVVSCTDCIIVCIKVNVHASGAGFSNHCIIVVCIILVDFDIAAAVNRQLSMAAVSEQAVTVNLSVYITVNSNLRSHLQGVVAAAVYQGAAIVTISTLLRGQAPFTVFVTHSGYITVKGYFGVACCIQAQGITNALDVHLGIAIDGQLHRVILVLLALAAYVDALNTTFGAVSIEHQLVSSNSYTVSAVGTNRMNGRVVGYIGVEGQGFAFGINGSSLVHISTMCISCGDAAVLSELIQALFFDYSSLIVFLILSLHTSQSCGKLILNLVVRCRKIRSDAVFVLQAAFAVLLGECHVASVHCCRRRRQAIGNLHITGQIVFVFSEVAVGQLACQAVQYVNNAVSGAHVDAAVIGNQGYYRILFSMLDNGIASLIVACCFAITGMCVVDVGVAAVVIDGDILSIVLEDVTCVCCIAAAGKVGYMAAGKAARNLFAVLLVCPGCTICQPQVKGTIAG